MNDIERYAWPELYEPAIGEKSKNYIFISYSHEDSDIVYQDLKILHENGARVWYDRAMHVGQSWIERAKTKIMDHNCVAVIFYVSDKSLVSEAFLRELEYANLRQNSDNSFVYISVNIGEKPAFELLKKLDVPEKQFLSLLTSFNEDKLFIPRRIDPFDQNHILSLIDVFEEKDAIDKTQCKIKQATLFDVDAYEQGLQITHYNGADSIITIPSSMNGKKILAIGINAFKNNNHVKMICVPEGIRKIDDFAFSGCNHLEDISLPISLESIGYETFRDCSSLTEIVLPYNVNTIGDYCFYRCHNIRNISLLSVVPLVIGFAAFSECQRIDVIELPETTKIIGSYAFNDCVNLESIIIPANVSSVGLSAFYNCATLKTVKIETPLVLENNKWFSRCRKITRIIVGAQQKEKYDREASWADYKEILQFKLESPINITYSSNILNWDSVSMADYYIVRINSDKYEVRRPILVVPSSPETTLAISISAHSDNESIISSDDSAEITIRSEENIFQIESVAEGLILKKYYGNSSIVTIPSGVTIIDEEAFYNHEEIHEIVFPEGVIEIKDRAFYHCINISRMKFPKSLKGIGREAFWGVSIIQLTIPPELEFIGDSGFACCNVLKELYIEARNLHCETKAFYRCINLKKVCFPNGIEEISEGMFRGCTELDEIELPYGTKRIKKGGISYVMRLKRIFIPETVEKIDIEAFSSSFGMTDIFVQEKNQHYYDKNGILCSKDESSIMYFPSDKKIKELHISDDIKVIQKFSFMDAEYLECVYCGKSIQLIGRSAFARCPNLKEIHITSPLERIDKEAFKDCISLRRIFLLTAIVPEIGEMIFDNVSPEFKVIIPSKHIKNYQRIIDWKKYQYLFVPFDDSLDCNQK